MATIPHIVVLRTKKEKTKHQLNKLANKRIVRAGNLTAHLKVVQPYVSKHKPTNPFFVGHTFSTMSFFSAVF